MESEKVCPSSLIKPAPSASEFFTRPISLPIHFQPVTIAKGGTAETVARVVVAVWVLVEAEDVLVIRLAVKVVAEVEEPVVLICRVEINVAVVVTLRPVVVVRVVLVP